MHMAKIVKKKRKLRIEAFATLFFFVSIFLYIGSMTALKSYNVLLSSKAETMSSELSKTQEQVSTLENKVKELEDSSRIMAMVEGDGMKANQDNVQLMNGE